MIDILSYKLGQKAGGGSPGGGGGGGGGGGSNEEWIGDGNTHLWISLEEGRTSPAVCGYPNGTVTVDWGDDTEPDVLTGTSTSVLKSTPNHNYATAGDYVITLTVDGEIKFDGINDDREYGVILRYAPRRDERNATYHLALQKVEIGNGVSLGGMAFAYYYNLKSVALRNGITSLPIRLFQNCYNLDGVIIPNTVTSIGDYAFQNCRSLKNIVIPNSVTNIGIDVFANCHVLSTASLSNNMTSVASEAFYNCTELKSVTIPKGITSISKKAFANCYNLTSIIIPDSVTSVGESAFSSCYGLKNVVVSNSVTSIADQAFYFCTGVLVFDFTQHTSVPALGSQVFQYTSSDWKILIPAALVDEWKAATNWSGWASRFVGV